MRTGRTAINWIALVLAAAAFVQQTRPSHAMPPFAQAYNYSCEQCHTAVPALNAYGRFVQRTGYAALDAQTVHRAVPLWVGEAAFYDAQDPNLPHRTQLGNLAVHAVGYAGSDVTFHLQQWITQANQPGGTDTFWFAYDKLAHYEGHLFVGKIEAPAPSPYSQWFALTAFAAPSVAVGEHAWQYGANRWGTKIDYTHGWINAQVGYLGGSGDLGHATGFGQNTDTSTQWWLSYANPKTPVEFGGYGTRGAFPLSDGSIDRYRGAAVYAEIDPSKSLPGMFVVYQRGTDDKPAPGFGSATSKGFSLDIYHPFFTQRALLGVRSEFVDDGLGSLTHTNSVDVQWLAVKMVGAKNATGLIANTEYVRTSAGKPDWLYQIWYVTTIGPLRSR